jgi:aminoglycoside phosphotransferase (APT) family kinase protein
MEAAMHGVTLRALSGERLRWVIRRYPDERLRADPEHLLREWAVLQALAASEIPSPRPVFLDPDGATLGQAAIVMSRLPGRPDLAPRCLDHWLRQLGVTLAAIHRCPGPAALPPVDEKLSWLRHRLLSNDLAAYAHGEELRTAIEDWLSRARIRQGVLVHGDFWPGNTLWLRGRLTGVVDWVYASRGEPAFDVAACRIDLTLLFGPAAATAFTTVYQAEAQDPLEDLPFWDLVNALRWLPDPAEALSSYHDLGRGDITAEAMREGFDRFVAAALTEGRGIRVCSSSL